MAIIIKDVDKAEVLMALYNAAQPGWLHRGYPKGPMERSEAKAILKESQNLSIVNGRALYVDLSGDELDVTIYDSHNGRLCAGEALAPLVSAAAERTRKPESDRDFISRVLAHAPIAAGPKG